MDTLHVEFSGNMVKGKKEGKGGFRCPNTYDFYYGGWQNNLKHGFGILYYGKDTYIDIFRTQENN